MRISSTEVGNDEDLAARILAHARYVIAPRLDDLDDQGRADAIAILRGVYAEAQARGVRGIVSQSVGTARVSYGAVSSWFTDDDRAALAALVAGVAGGGGGEPRGSFPRPSPVVSGLFPEEV